MVGIIGGDGAMGQMFTEIFKAYEATVRIGRKTDVPNHLPMLTHCDVVVVSVPIDQTPKVIQNIAPHLQPKQLLCDLTSVKETPIKAMLQSTASVIGCHPLFGPTANLQKERIALCPARPGIWLPWLTNCFTHAGMEVIEMNAKAHDRAMAIVQSATHFTHMVYAEMMHEINQEGLDGNDLAHILSLSTPAMRAHLQALQRVLGGDPALYAQIQTANPNTPKVLNRLLAIAQNLAQHVSQGDTKRVSQHYKRGSAFVQHLKQCTNQPP